MSGTGKRFSNVETQRFVEINGTQLMEELNLSETTQMSEVRDFINQFIYEERLYMQTELNDFNAEMINRAYAEINVTEVVDDCMHLLLNTKA